ncbi:MAG TPA: hypothetical protein VEU54_06565 [Steroidobacteraceae bacterium]|jgi:hypothetical protein|nr:hypothetical protein [Steroidobacteraceae bacterium]
METLAHLWDELDDVAGVCRHLATAAAAEFLAGSIPYLAAAASLGVWLLLPDFRLNAALLASLATFWGAYRQLLT